MNKNYLLGTDVLGGAVASPKITRAIQRPVTATTMRAPAAPIAPPVTSPIKTPVLETGTTAHIPSITDTALRPSATVPPLIVNQTMVNPALTTSKAAALAAAGNAVANAAGITTAGRAALAAAANAASSGGSSSSSSPSSSSPASPTAANGQTLSAAQAAVKKALASANALVAKGKAFAGRLKKNPKRASAASIGQHLASIGAKLVKGLNAKSAQLSQLAKTSLTLPASSLAAKKSTMMGYAVPNRDGTPYTPPASAADTSITLNPELEQFHLQQFISDQLFNGQVTQLNTLLTQAADDATLVQSIQTQLDSMTGTADPTTGIAATATVTDPTILAQLEALANQGQALITRYNTATSTIDTYEGTDTTDPSATVSLDPSAPIADWISTFTQLHTDSGTWITTAQAAATGTGALPYSPYGASGSSDGSDDGLDDGSDDGLDDGSSESTDQYGQPDDGLDNGGDFGGTGESEDQFDQDMDSQWDQEQGIDPNQGYADPSDGYTDPSGGYSGSYGQQMMPMQQPLFQPYFILPGMGGTGMMLPNGMSDGDGSYGGSTDGGSSGYSDGGISSDEQSVEDAATSTGDPGEDVSGDDAYDKPFTLTSELPNVSDADWTKFIMALKTQRVGAVSPSNALGMFELKPRRLADLGLITNLSSMRTDDGKRVYTGDFVAPLTSKMFLSNPSLQYKVLAKSLNDYASKLKDGTIPKPDGGKPSDMTLSGVLAILHRAGPNGLNSWNTARFPDTSDLYAKSNGIF